MRDQQLARGMRAAAVLGFFTILGSGYQIWASGWHRIMYLHIALYLLVLAAVFLRRYIPYQVRAGAMSSIVLLVGTGSLITWGFGAFSLLALFCACVLFTIFFSARAGIVSSIVSVSIIGIVGVLVSSGFHSYSYDAMEHLNAPALWLSAMCGMALVSALVVVVLGTLNHQVEELVSTLETQNNELLEKKRLLENEIVERIRAEEERRKLEEMLQLARRMEMVGQLAGGVAHDLNNTLGGIVGYPDLLLEDLPADSPLRETILTIKRSGIKAAAIVNDMLTLARSGITTTEVLDFNSVVRDYLASPEFEQLVAFHKNVDVHTRLHREPLKVKGSFFHLSKIIMNLLSNAAEAMPDGGQLVISTEKRRIAEQAGMPENFQAGDYVVLSVSDTGIGIPPEDLTRVFEPFFTKKKMGRSGTGLGMSVVWRSVRDHDGHITVDSVEDKGSTFTVYLPLTDEPVSVRNLKDAPVIPRGRGESILVVDDVEEQREMASHILRKMGYSVRTAASGEEAIADLQKAPADLLILDMLMHPGIDGLETYKRVLAINPGQKAIIATGYSETQIKEAFSLGIAGVLKKPYSLDQIGRAVRAGLDRPAAAV